MSVHTVTSESRQPCLCDYQEEGGEFYHIRYRSVRKAAGAQPAPGATKSNSLRINRKDSLFLTVAVCWPIRGTDPGDEREGADRFHQGAAGADQLRLFRHRLVGAHVG